MMKSGGTGAQKNDNEEHVKSRRFYKVKPKKPESEGEQKLAEPRIRLSEHKAVYVTASNYNEELGILALVLIDKEIKIYYIRQNGTSINLIEHFSFKTKFDISCIHLDRHVLDGKPILICGT